ncbi:MAG: hypothetical protein GF419_04005 [Ignavibacteriales bacterium]|nr:hypothetical protein [Ignavibacteriales bacterium]
MRKFTVIFAAFFIGALALTACDSDDGGDSPTDGNGDGDGATVTSTSGAIVGHDAANHHSVVARVSDFFTAPFVVDSAAIGSGGTFTLDLAATPPADYLDTLELNLIEDFFAGDSIQVGCSGEFTISDEGAQTAFLGIYAVGDDPDSASTLYQATAPVPEDLNNLLNYVKETLVFYVYVDRATTVAGSQTCSVSIEEMNLSVTVTADASMNEGWNQLALKFESFNILSGSISISATSEIPSNLNWYVE